jgi:hypothetical protein
VSPENANPTKPTSSFRRSISSRAWRRPLNTTTELVAKPSMPRRPVRALHICISTGSAGVISRGRQEITCSPSDTVSSGMSCPDGRSLFALSSIQSIILPVCASDGRREKPSAGSSSKRGLNSRRHRTVCEDGKVMLQKHSGLVTKS